MSDEIELQKKMLAKWIGQRDHFNRLIEAMQIELGQAADLIVNSGSTEVKQQRSSGSEHIVPGEFFGLSQTEAAAKYLKKVGHAVHVDTILDVLQAGGVKFEGRDPKTTLYTSLIRGNRRFVLVSRGTFGLAEFYPDRPKPEKVEPKKKKKSPSKAASKNHPKPAAAKKDAAPKQKAEATGAQAPEASPPEQ